MEFGTLDFNNLVLLGIAVVGLINTILTIRANKNARAATAIAVETLSVAKKTESNTKNIVTKVKKEHTRMAGLLDDALGAVNKKGHRR